ncbi:MAG: cofactor-independent phosphoglycerate mutase [Candidatus Sumerlaeia bacterium]
MKYVVFLGDGMADEPMDALSGKTPLMVADTPNMDALARRARFGTFLSLPDAFPTSSDVANLSVLGYDLAEAYQGRGPLEAASQGIVLKENQIALRCNLIHSSDDGVLVDYSGGQIGGDEAAQLIDALNECFGSDKVRFHTGVSYRNLLVLTGDEFSADFHYEKPDDHPGDAWAELLPKGEAGTPGGRTAEFLRKIMVESVELLNAHPVNRARAEKGLRTANMCWFWSAGRKPQMRAFQEMYGKSGAVISAVDVIKGIGVLGDMEVVEVEGATGYIDTNYEGKARAAVEALKRHDFVYLHVEAVDEVSHAGDLDLKIKTISEFDKRLIGAFLREFGDMDRLALAVLPDHPVPVKICKHTRTPVPVMFVHPGVESDNVGRERPLCYNEIDAPEGSIGLLKKDGVMQVLFG